MVINLSALTEYTDELASELIKKSVLSGRTLETGVSVQVGVKHIDALNLMTSTLQAQATSCGMNPTGSVALLQRDIKVCPLTVFEDICLNDLESYWVGKRMAPGSNNEQLPFEVIYVDDKVAKVQALAEDLFWKGSSTPRNVTGAGTASGNLALCNGILDILQFQTGSASVNIASTTASFSKTNSIDIIDNIVSTFEATATDAIGQDNVNIYISYPNFTLLTQALRDANFFHYDASQGDYRINGYLGTSYNIIAVRGLNGSNRIVMTPASNLYWGVDMLNDQEKFDIFYDKTLDKVFTRVKWKQGAQVAFPEFVVLYNR